MFVYENKKQGTINVQVDAKDKEQATNVLKNLELNISTAISTYIKQIIKYDVLPFEISSPKQSKELLEALEELEEVESGKIN